MICSHYHAFAFLQLIVGRSCADVEHLRSQASEFLEFQRTVVKRRRQTEAIFHKIHLCARGRRHTSRGIAAE